MCTSNGKKNWKYIYNGFRTQIQTVDNIFKPRNSKHFAHFTCLSIAEEQDVLLLVFLFNKN